MSPRRRPGSAPRGSSGRSGRRRGTSDRSRDRRPPPQEDSRMTEPMIEHLDAVWGDVAGLAADLTDEQWSLPTDCPGWSVHDNVAHMIGTERLLLGEQPPAVGTEAAHVRNDIGKANEAWIATYADFTGPDLLAEFRAVTARRLDALRSLGPEDWDREGFTPE